MQTGLAEEITEIANDIERGKRVLTTRLSVLNQWFDVPARLSAFAIFIANRAIDSRQESCNEAEILFAEVRSLLNEQPEYRPTPSRFEAEALYRKLRSFQSEYWGWRWMSIRDIHNPHLFLIEESLNIYLRYCT